MTWNTETSYSEQKIWLVTIIFPIWACVGILNWATTRRTIGIETNWNQNFSEMFEI